MRRRGMVSALSPHHRPDRARADHRRRACRRRRCPRRMDGFTAARIVLGASRRRTSRRHRIGMLAAGDRTRRATTRIHSGRPLSRWSGRRREDRRGRRRRYGARRWGRRVRQRPPLAVERSDASGLVGASGSQAITFLSHPSRHGRAYGAQREKLGLTLLRPHIAKPHLRHRDAASH